MVSCDGRNWHQRIADYCLHADKELVAKISQDAKERKAATQIQPGRVLPSEATAQGREPQKTGEATEVLAEIAGTGTCKYEALVEKISKAAKERQLSTLKQGTDVPDRSVPTQREEPGKVSKKLAKIAGTGK
ncbi:hypothetical protein [Methanothrix sp.]|uniref:hypothetical protein n=1 Tax=Methanothrix sp. TaxID=90426 RepID=UPI003BB81637